jgi:hypothetical protein
MRKPERPSRCSSSFAAVEVQTMCKVFETIARGGDARVLLRSTPVYKTWAKFQHMRKTLEDRGYGEQSAGKQAKQEAPRAQAAS